MELKVLVEQRSVTKTKRKFLINEKGMTGVSWRIQTVNFIGSHQADCTVA